MIVDDRGETWTLVTQGDHARLAGEILTLWRADGLPDHPRRNRLIAATRGHDDGWSGADAAPRIDPRHGRPWVFDELPADLRFEIWRQGIEDNAKRDAYRGLLVACHALHLHADRESEPDWAEFLAAIRERRDELAEATEVAVEEVGDEYRLLHLADLISLAAACRWSGPLESSGRRLELDGRTVTVDPFPLAGATTFRLPCRSIPARRYARDSELGIALSRARWTEEPVRLVPFTGTRDSLRPK